MKKSKSSSPGKSGKKLSQISRNSNLGELVFKYPKTAEVLIDYGLHCAGCGAMNFDTIEVGARIHGLSDQEIDGLVARINEVVKFNE